MRIIIATFLMFLFWMVLSGHTEVWLLLLGAASAGLTIYLSNRMNIMDSEAHPFHLTLRLLRYFSYLGKEILITNLDVAKRILTPGRTISPQVIELPDTKKTNLGKVVYANSITLTPGTVTLELTDNKIKVHAISKESAESLQDGHMANKVPEDEAHPS